MTSGTKRLELRIQLTVLNDLGIKLYSNTPAVLSELVANSWDADASSVEVLISTANQTIIIEDNGFGMDFQDLQDKYLTIGYQKRGNQSNIDTTPSGRKIMGRKGIGKLSMFSIAKRAEIHTVKLSPSGKEVYRGGIVLDLAGIELSAKTSKPYLPTIIPASKVKDLKVGTRILLSDIDKDLAPSVGHLRTRLARRFSVTGPKEKFDVKVNKSPISPEERDYFHRLQYVWWIGKSERTKYSSFCKNLNAEDGQISIPEIKVPLGKNKFGKISGWIGFVKTSNQTRDDNGESLNRIILMARGKLAQEDLLPSINEDRLGKVYLMGELHADFIDDTELEDIALSSRQGIKENAPRYKKLIEHVRPTVKKIVSEWDKKRKEKDTEDILDIPEIKEWLDLLDNKGDQTFAKKLVAKVASSTGTERDSRKAVIKHCILAFENLRYEDRLHRLDEMDSDDISQIAEVFSDISRLEATTYGEIARGRIHAITKLQELVDTKALEKEFQLLIAKNLWLLDAAWDRANKGDELVEKSIFEAWAKIQDKADLKAGRVDLAYKTVAGLDVIVELKRSSRKDFDSNELLVQCQKYLAAYRAAKKIQQKAVIGHRIFIVVGHFPKDWHDDDEQRKISQGQFATINATLVTYDELLANARESYRDYLEGQSRVNSLLALMRRIDSSN